MGRLARIVVPGLPDHVTARDNRRKPVFFEGGGRDFYRDIPAGQMRRREVTVRARGALH